uniref:uncharacterized protein n=1 Tax=Centroberyx gerrardi TaxID=166262 RepID=UPI003AAD3EAC
MLHLKDGLSLKSQLSPIVAVVGDDIILPCHLEPAMDVVAMTLEWARPDLDPRFVHVWRDGQELVSYKHPSYMGRTSLFIDKLKHGDISLKLSKVKLSDEGRYRCFIPSLGRDSITELVVGAVSSPVVVITKNSSGVVLGCESKGWYPEPEVFWLDGEGNILSAGPTETVRGPDGLYTVSSRVTVEKTDTNRFTCRVQQQNINQTRETQIHVPDVPFPAAVYISIVSAVVFMCIVAVVFVVWKWRRNKIKTKMQHEGETEQRGEKKTKSMSNNTELQFLMEGQRDGEQLMAERAAKSHLDKREGEKTKSISNKTGCQFPMEGERHQEQHGAEGEAMKDLEKGEGENITKSMNNETGCQFLMEGERQQEQLGTERETKTHLDKGEGEKLTKSISNETGHHIPIEGERHQKQHMTERKAMKDLNKEGEKTTKSINSDTELEEEIRKQEQNQNAIGEQVASQEATGEQDGAQEKTMKQEPPGKPGESQSTTGKGNSQEVTGKQEESQEATGQKGKSQEATLEQGKGQEATGEKEESQEVTREKGESQEATGKPGESQVATGKPGESDKKQLVAERETDKTDLKILEEAAETEKDDDKKPPLEVKMGEVTGVAESKSKAENQKEPINVKLEKTEKQSEQGASQEANGKQEKGKVVEMKRKAEKKQINVKSRDNQEVPQARKLQEEQQHKPMDWQNGSTKRKAECEEQLQEEDMEIEGRADIYEPQSKRRKEETI